MLIAIASLSLLSIFWMPYPPLASDNACALLPPSFTHIAGCDTLGRDILSRLMAGSRFTLLSAAATVAVSSLLGTVLGTIAGYKGGILDTIIMRGMDAISSFPGILLALVMAGATGGGRKALVSSLAIMFTPSYTRLMRLAAASLRNQDFIRRERAIGASPLAVIKAHIVPNAWATLLPAILVGISNAILAECTLSFLGLGTPPPMPSWGRMLSDAGQCVLSSPWYAAITGLVITAAAASFNLIAGSMGGKSTLTRQLSDAGKNNARARCRHHRQKTLCVCQKDDIGVT